jgi:hypothetical protein
MLFPAISPSIHEARKLFVGARNEGNEGAFGWDKNWNNGTEESKYASRTHKYS